MSGAENLLYLVLFLYLTVIVCAFLLRVLRLRTMADQMVRAVNRIILLPFTIFWNLLRAAHWHRHRRKRPLTSLNQPTSFAAYSPGPATESGWYLVHRHRRDILELAGPYREPYQNKPPTCMLAVRCPYEFEKLASTWYWISAPDRPGAPFFLTPVMSNAERRAAYS